MPRVPKRLVEDLDSVELSSTDKHLLALVDGSLSEQELAFVTGKSVEQVAEELESLAMMGMVDFVGRTVDPSADDISGRAGVPAGAADESVPADESAAADAQAVPGVDLPAEEIVAIDALLGRLDRCNYYELLGLETDASKKEIRSAYNKLARRFHPDRHFRKELGPYKQKIEFVFARLTQAHDTLRSKKRRVEYDQSERIEHRIKSDPPKAAKPSPPPVAPVARAGDRQSAPPPAARPPTADGEQPQLVPRSATEPPGAPASGSRPPPARGRVSTPPQMADRASTPPQAPTPPAPEPARPRRPAARAKPRAVGAAAPAAATRPAVPSPKARARGGRAGPAARATTPGLGGIDPEQARRVRAEALKRKMASARRFSVPPPGGRRAARTTNPRGRTPAAATPVQETTAAPESYEPVQDVERSAAEVYRERFDRIGRVARQRRCERYVAQAKAAFSRGDYRLAAEAFRMAAELSGEDPQLQKLAEEAAELAAQGK